MEERIKKVRKKFGLTQAEFGSRVGVRGNTVTGYETGVRSPSDVVLKAISTEFGVDEGWLKNGGADEVQLKPPTEREIVDAIARAYRQGAVFRAVMDAYLAMSEQDRAVLDAFIKNLAAGIAPDQALADPGLVLEKLDGEAASPVNIEYKSE